MSKTTDVSNLKHRQEFEVTGIAEDQNVGIG